MPWLLRSAQVDEEARAAIIKGPVELDAETQLDRAFYYGSSGFLVYLGLISKAKAQVHCDILWTEMLDRLLTMRRCL